MDSDLQLHHQHQHQQQQMNSGLMRYQSAPSSYFSSFVNSGVGGGVETCDEFLNPPRPSTPETDRIFARFMPRGGTENLSSHNPCDIGQNSSANEALQSPYTASTKHEPDIFHHHQQQQQNNDFSSSSSQIIYQNQSQPNLNSAGSNSGLNNSYTGVGSMAMERLPQMKMGGGGGGSSNLIRQNSSPAGFFSHINVENGYGGMRGMVNFGASNGTNIVEASFPSPSRLKGQMDFSSGPPSSSGPMTPISETGSKSMGMSDTEDGIFGHGHRNDRSYITGFPIGSWDDSAILSDNSPRLEDDDRKTFSSMNASDNQSAEGGNRSRSRPPTSLSHHLSLPNSSAELEKLFQFQDSVPCKIRAKRGCATHPRSIAERVRRTRISERIRKLQELVPNMDTQTNTSDMLDLAVDYIKELKQRVQVIQYPFILDFDAKR